MAHDPTAVPTILVVEDDARSRAVIASMLEATGYRVLTAGDAIDALTAFSSAGPEIDIVLSDVQMPGMNGPDLLACLRSRKPKLRTLLMSGFTEGLQVTTPILQKPFGMADLETGLATALEPVPNM